METDNIMKTITQWKIVPYRTIICVEGWNRYGATITTKHCFTMTEAKRLLSNLRKENKK